MVQTHEFKGIKEHSHAHAHREKNGGIEQETDREDAGSQSHLHTHDADWGGGERTSSRSHLMRRGDGVLTFMPRANSSTTIR